MKVTLLIADSCDILRYGLRKVFASDERVESIYEASTNKDLQAYLRANEFDLILVNQFLIEDINILPKGRFVILAPELDIAMFHAAYKHGAKGYFLENTSSELLRAILNLEDNTFLIDPALTLSIINNISMDPRLTVKEQLLTPREREVVEMLREGIDRANIARHLNISELTLKTHIKNITRKSDTKHWDRLPVTVRTGAGYAQ